MINKIVKHRKTGKTGKIIEVDDTCYEPTHSKDNPWITILHLENNPTGFDRTSGTLNTLRQDWLI